MRAAAAVPKAKPARRPATRIRVDYESLARWRAAAKGLTGDEAAAEVERLLAPFGPLDRVRARRLDDHDSEGVLAFAGISRCVFYREIAAGRLRVERAS